MFVKSNDFFPTETAEIDFWDLTLFGPEGIDWTSPWTALFLTILFLFLHYGCITKSFEIHPYSWYPKYHVSTDTILDSVCGYRTGVGVRKRCELACHPWKSAKRLPGMVEQVHIPFTFVYSLLGRAPLQRPHRCWLGFAGGPGSGTARCASVRLPSNPRQQRGIFGLLGCPRTHLKHAG